MSIHPQKRPAMFAAAMIEDLLVVADFDGESSAEDRAHALTKAFFAWPKLCRAMAVLEEMFPEQADTARALDERVVGIIERRDAA